VTLRPEPLRLHRTIASMTWPVAWLLPAFIAAALACWYAWSHGMPLVGGLLLAVSIGLVVLLGRRIEADRAADWERAAAVVQGSYRGAQPNSFLASFGGSAPWTAWASDGELQCPHAIDGSANRAPFWLLQIRYSVRERRGEEHPDSWYEVAVAVLRIADGAPGPLQPLQAGGEYQAASNGAYLFVTKKGPRGAGQPLDGAQLPALLQHARAVLSRLPATAPAR
jgi:hypothetical protein